MKKLLDVSVRVLTLICFVLLLSCGSDDDGGTPPPDGNDPNDFCSVELCSTSDLAKNECIDDYNDCLNLNESTDAECQVFALNACNL